MGWRSTLDPKFDSKNQNLVLAVTKTDHDKKECLFAGENRKAEIMSMGAEKNSAGTRSGPENVYFRRINSGKPPLVAIDLYSHLH